MIRSPLFLLLISLALNLFAAKDQDMGPVSPTFQTRRESWSTPDTHPEIQLGNGVDLIYATLFQNLSFLDAVGLGGFKQEIYAQSLFLRRLYLVFGLGGVEYKAMDGSSGYWPFPLASMLTQGQRVLVVLTGISYEEFLNFLTNGNLDLFYKRKYSSHGVKICEKTDTLEEVKIKNPLRSFESTEIVLGLDFPFGGVGTVLPNGGCVGPRGWEIKKGKLKKNKQIGHLHLYARSFPSSNRTAILIGIESCAPGSQNQLGCDHNLLSGIRNQTINRSVSGGSKWAQLNVSVARPAEYAGKKVHLSLRKFRDIKKRIEEILALEEKSQEGIFRKILPEDSFFATGFLWTYSEERKK
ncbi:MAG: hypothetical protein A2621_00775 [Alphaproteobacteria bacterium RIFCSPHIGHO2_01_FULL_41_14]|nr:MAG: hypothetical protein A3K20_02015 [Alphaproteobacteria bacterium GWA1_45_9]OFW89448.1 MAG: hypothetical protein A2621_00775 [Alphaproteobacteria bacterium RIFCSPHIGHO2_01_FULL_41_14]HCI48654.1 hypothetical protein [Holosporales bacterium]